MTAKLAALVVSWILFGVGWSASAGAGEVRAVQHRAERLIAKGVDRSATFRSLIDALAYSDLVVYVDLAPFDDRKMEGALEFVGSGVGMRFVKVWLCPMRTDDEMLVTFGHELQHALEVARASEVVSQATFATFYSRTGRSDSPRRFETRAAQQVGALIRAELNANVPQGREDVPLADDLE